MRIATVTTEAHWKIRFIQCKPMMNPIRRLQTDSNSKDLACSDLVLISAYQLYTGNLALKTIINSICQIIIMSVKRFNNVPIILHNINMIQ